MKGIPPAAYYGRIIGNPDEPWDIARSAWLPDHLDPYTYLNLLFDGQFARGGNNLPHFDEPKYNRLLRRTARLRGQARYRAYGALDVRLAREAAPSVPIDYANEPTLVSARVDRSLHHLAADATPERRVPEMRRTLLRAISYPEASLLSRGPSDYRAARESQTADPHRPRRCSPRRVRVRRRER